MRRKQLQTIWMISIPILSALLLFACSDSDSAPKVSYRMTVTNLTHNQPLSPVAFVLHTAGYVGWETGASASAGLEILAESGDTSAFLDDADGNTNVLATAAGSGAIGPGGSDSVDIEINPNTDLRLSFATMLVNTNDAFTGMTDKDISDLATNESVTFIAIAYDAGTEVNSETGGSIPGPAAGGEGHNPELNDSGFIAVHPGVVTAADGLATSALDESHRWRNPVARLTVTKTN